MTTTPSRSGSDGAAFTLCDLASFLQDAGNGFGYIRIPARLDDAITRILQTRRTIPAAEVTAVVDTLECTQRSICNRLSTRSFIILVAIFRVSEPCWSQQRGLCLLTESLRDDDFALSTTQISGHASNGPAVHSRRKERLGTEILGNSLQQLCNPKVNPGARRWMGLLTFELLKECEENQKLIELGSDDRRRLIGSLIATEQDEVLRVVAGTVIGELLATGIDASQLWPRDMDSGWYDNFPTQVQVVGWTERFRAYLDKCDSLHLRKTSFACFALMLCLDDQAYEGFQLPNTPTEQRYSILVTFSTSFCIILSAHGSRDGQYIDIAVNRIMGIELNQMPQEAIPNAPSKGSHSLKLHLGCDRGANVHRNAKPLTIKSIRFTLGDLNAAQQLMDHIRAYRKETRKIRSSRSVDVLDVSRVPIAKEGDLMSTPDNMDAGKKDLVATARKASEILQTKLALDMEDPFSGPNMSQNSGNLFHAQARYPKVFTASPVLANPELIETQGARIDTVGRMNEDDLKGKRFSHPPRHITDLNAPSPADSRPVAKMTEESENFERKDKKGDANNGKRSSADLFESRGARRSASMDLVGVAAMVPNHTARTSVLRPTHIFHHTQNPRTARKDTNARKLRQRMQNNRGEEIDSISLQEKEGALTKKRAKRGSLDQGSSTIHTVNGYQGANEEDPSQSGAKGRPTAPSEGQGIEGEDVLREDVYDVPDSSGRSNTRARDAMKRGGFVKLSDKSSTTNPRSKKAVNKGVASSNGSRLKAGRGKEAVAGKKLGNDLLESSDQEEPTKLNGAEGHRIHEKGAVQEDADLIRTTKVQLRKAPSILSTPVQSEKGLARKTHLRPRISQDLATSSGRAKPAASKPKQKRPLAPPPLKRSTRAAAIKANQKLHDISIGEAIGSQVTERQRASLDSMDKNKDADHTVDHAVDKTPSYQNQSLNSDTSMARNGGARKVLAEPSIKQVDNDVKVGAPTANINSLYTVGVIKPPYQATANVEAANSEVSSAHAGEPAMASIQVTGDDETVNTVLENQTHFDDAMAFSNVDAISDALLDKQNPIKGHCEGSPRPEEHVKKLLRATNFSSVASLPHKPSTSTKPIPSGQDTETSTYKAHSLSVKSKVNTVHEMLSPKSGLEERTLVAPQAPMLSSLAKRKGASVGAKMKDALAGIMMPGDRIGHAPTAPAQHSGDANTLWSRTSFPARDRALEDQVTRNIPFDQRLAADQSVKPVSLQTPVHKSLSDTNAQVPNEKAAAKVIAVTLGSSIVREERAGTHLIPMRRYKADTQVSEVIELSSGNEASSEQELTDSSSRKPSPQKVTMLHPGKKRKHADPGNALLESPKPFKSTKTTLSEDNQLTTPMNHLRTPMIIGPAKPAATDDRKERKAHIISFSAKGPRNQGMLSGAESTKQPSLAVPVRRNVPEISFTDNGNVGKHIITPEYATKTQNSKLKQRGGRQTQEEGQTLIPTSALPSILRKPSSQVSIVDQNGSPRPPLDAAQRANGGWGAPRLRNEFEQGDKLYLVDAVATDAGPAETQDSGAGPSQPPPSSRFDGSPFVHDTIEIPSSRSSNRKLLPSSPTAPSRMLKDITLHEEHPQGFINIRTASVVKPEQPQDPFVTRSPRTTNAFTELLRAVPNRYEGTRNTVLPRIGRNKHKNELYSVHMAKHDAELGHVRIDATPRPAHVRTKAMDKRTTVQPAAVERQAQPAHRPRPMPKRKAMAMQEEDDALDKTLVSDLSTRRHAVKRRRSQSTDDLQSSTSPDDVSFAVASADEASVQQAMDRQWREALKPHQKKTLVTLYRISNSLVRHLINKEDALQEITDEYDMDGARLIEWLGEAHQTSHGDWLSRAAERGKLLVSCFEEVNTGMESDGEMAKGHHVEDRKKGWRLEHAALESTLKGALEVYAN